MSWWKDLARSWKFISRKLGTVYLSWDTVEDTVLSAVKDLPRMAGACFIFQDQTSLLCEFGSSPTLEFL